MRKAFRWLLLVLFIVLNGFIIVWAWRQLRDPPQAIAETKQERKRASSEQYGRTDQLASDLIAKWNRDPVIKLDSDELPSAVESLPEAACIRLPSGAQPIQSASLPPAVKRDLDAAVTGLLQAYREGTPDALITYMSGRGKAVGQSQRNRMQGALLRSGVKDIETLTDEDVYRTMWTKFKPNAHWSGLVADSSCRQFWDGKKVLFNRVGSFSQNITVDKLTGQMEQAEYLVQLLRGVLSGQHNFESTSGSLEDAHKTDAQVLLCDVQLVMELDESFSHAKAPYLIRFWFNTTLQKWQPFDMLSFNSNPKGGPLPSMQF